MTVDYMKNMDCLIGMEDMNNEIKKTNCSPCNRSNVF